MTLVASGGIGRFAANWAHEDNADVVITAPLVGLGDQAIARLVQRSTRFQYRSDLGIGQHRIQPVGAQQIDVIVVHLVFENVDLRFAVSAKGLSHDVFQRMSTRRLLGQEPGFDLFMHPRMVVCEE